MPDLGERGNVMGPQPIGKIVEPPAAMLAAAGQLLTAIMRGDFAAAEAMTTQQARDDIAGITRALKPGAYDKFELVGRGRVAKHYFLKARISGSGSGNEAAPIMIQFRLGEDGGKWTVREVLNLTGRRSGWTK